MPGISRKKKQFLILAVLLALGLTAGSLLPDAAVDEMAGDAAEPLHAVAHVTGYGLLTWLLCFYFRFERVIRGLRIDTRTACFLAVIAALIWGGINEGLQMFRPDRYASWLDYFNNMIGIAGGAAAFRFWRYSFRHRAKKRLPGV